MDILFVGEIDHKISTIHPCGVGKNIHKIVDLVLYYLTIYEFAILFTKKITKMLQSGILFTNNNDNQFY